MLRPGRHRRSSRPFPCLRKDPTLSDTKVPLKPKGWHSRRHETPAAHHSARDKYGSHSERQRRRRAAALVRRESQLTRYLLGVFDKHVRLTDEGTKIERAQAEVDRLRELLSI